MRIESLKLKGFTGIKKGLGLDEIALDLSGLSGLIALAGPNGKGKSTLLENLHPFRSLASRAGSLQHHVFLRDSLKALAFRWNGALYETQVKVDAQSGRAEAFIWKDAKPEIRGKVSEYDSYMRELLGSEQLFFNSVFCAQGSEKLSDMTTGQLKGLFSEFLRLDRLIAYENTSKQAAVMLNGKAVALGQAIAQLQQTVAKRADMEAALENLRGDWDGLTHSKGELEKWTEAAEAELQTARGKAHQNDVLKVKLDGFKKAKDQAGHDIRDIDARLAADLDALTGQMEALSRQQQDIGMLLSSREQVHAAAARVAEIDSMTGEYREKIYGFTRAISDLQMRRSEVEKGLFALRSEYKALQADHKTAALQYELMQLETQTADLNRRDPACQSTTCSFIVRALQAETRIPQCRDELEARKAETAARAEELKAKGLELSGGELSRINAALEGQEGSRAEIISALEALETERRATATVAAKAGEVETAAARLDGIKERISELRLRRDDITERGNREAATKATQISALDAQITELQAGIDQEAEVQVKATEDRIAQLKIRIADIESRITETQGKSAGIEAQLAEIEKAEAQLAEKHAARARAISEASDWQYLQAACSKDGLRALEIDSVAPTISAYANDLLSRTFGPLFSVRFRTQDDSGREVLDILAIREDGTETLIENLSGGERVWILKALRLAMTLVSKEKSARLFKTAMADEEDGALDVENGQNFIQMYRAFLSAGGFDAMYYISHKAESISMADHVLVFGNGGVGVR